MDSSDLLISPRRYRSQQASLKPTTPVTSPKPKKTQKAAKAPPQTRAERLLDSFKLELLKTLDAADAWSTTDWKNNAGLYADTQAVLEALFIRDCFDMLALRPTKPEPQPRKRKKRGTVEIKPRPVVDKDFPVKLKPGVEEGFSLGARLLKRLSDNGPAKTVSAIKESYLVGMSWQARSLDKMDIASLFDIAY